MSMNLQQQQIMRRKGSKTKFAKSKKMYDEFQYPPSPSEERKGIIYFLKAVCVAMIVCFLVFGLLLHFWKSLANPGKNIGISQDLYSVVFDAGSTGSRMFVFHFILKEKDAVSGANVVLREETSASVEPGISHYVKEPSGAAISLLPMLETAIASVPPSFQSSTLITVKATAGLRLLPQNKGHGIIVELRHMFKKSPFYLPSIETIQVMAGEEEGLFGWISVNFLLDVLWDSDSDNTVSALDLGGGSMQTTFELPFGDIDETRDFNLRHVYKLKLLHSQFDVFTHSYLGFGLNSARMGILERAGIESGESSVPPENWQTNCMNADNKTVMWKHQNLPVNISGMCKVQNCLPQCLREVQQFVQNEPFVRSPHLWRTDMHLFSYFFDVAAWAGIVKPGMTLVLLTPDDFRDAAIYYCEKRVENHYPFICMDLIYIFSLLTDGLGVPLDKVMHVEKKLVGREVSWSLGAALASLSPDFSYRVLHNMLHTGWQEHREEF